MSTGGLLGMPGGNVKSYCSGNYFITRIIIQQSYTSTWYLIVITVLYKNCIIEQKTQNKININQGIRNEGEFM